MEMNMVHGSRKYKKVKTLFSSEYYIQSYFKIRYVK